MLNPLLWLLGRIIRWGYGHYLMQTHEGIDLCDVAGAGKDKQFVVYTVRALELIKSSDPRRFRRLQRHFECIVNLRLLTAASYDKRLRICELDFSRFYCTEDAESAILYLAAALVHEATHGAVCSRKISHDKKRRLRIERLCHREEARFIHRINPEVDLGAFDEAGYAAFYRTSRWRLAVDALKYARKPNEPSA